MGFPTRPNRTTFGPEFEEERPVTNPARELSAETANLLAWQTAGMGLTTPRVFMHCTVAGGVVTTAAQAWSFDPDGAQSTLTLGYTSTGIYTFTFAQQYNDEKGNAVNLDLIGGTATAQGMSTLAVGVVTFTNGYSGTIRFYDHSNGAIEATEFVLLLW